MHGFNLYNNNQTYRHRALHIQLSNAGDVNDCRLLRMMQQHLIRFQLTGWQEVPFERFNCIINSIALRNYLDFRFCIFGDCTS